MFTTPLLSSANPRRFGGLLASRSSMRRNSSANPEKSRPALISSDRRTPVDDLHRAKDTRQGIHDDIVAENTAVRYRLLSDDAAIPARRSPDEPAALHSRTRTDRGRTYDRCTGSYAGAGANHHRAHEDRILCDEGTAIDHVVCCVAVRTRSALCDALHHPLVERQIGCSVDYAGTRAVSRVSDDPFA